MPSWFPAEVKDPVGLGVSHYSATIDWGDGSSSAGVIEDHGNNNYGVRGSHTYANLGDYPVIVRFSADDGRSVTAQSRAQIRNGRLVSMATNGHDVYEGDSKRFELARFADENRLSAPSEYSASIKWGDGAVSQGQVTRAATTGSPFFVVTATHRYVHWGTYPVAVSIRDDEGATLAAPTTIRANEQSFEYWNSTGGFRGVGESATWTVSCIRDANRFGRASDFSARTQWGDGTKSAAVVRAARSQCAPVGADYSVEATHTYKKAGKFNPTTTITSDGGLVATAKWTGLEIHK